MPREEPHREVEITPADEVHARQFARERDRVLDQEHSGAARRLAGWLEARRARKLAARNPPPPAPPPAPSREAAWTMKSGRPAISDPIIDLTDRWMASDGSAIDAVDALERGIERRLRHEDEDARRRARHDDVL